MKIYVVYDSEGEHTNILLKPLPKAHEKTLRLKS